MRVVIVGAGVFGVTTALALSQREPTYDITIVDRHTPPAPDGSSVDSSRIVRADYANKIYADLMVEAESLWKTDPQLSQLYRPSGLLLCDEGDTGYVKEAYKVVKGLSTTQKTQIVEGGLHGIKKHMSKDARSQDISGVDNDKWTGYINKSSGWADAGASVELYFKRAVSRPNVRFIQAEVTSILFENDSVNSRVTGVSTTRHGDISGDIVIIAAGAWSAQLVDLNKACISTGQAVAYFKVSREEEERYKDMPIVFDLSSGCFVIPPRDGEMKVARHALGYYNPKTIKGWRTGSPDRIVSVPRTPVTHPNDTLPEEGELALRNWMKIFTPEFADREFSKTRLCWYTDTSSGDFLVSYHPNNKNLFIATAGCGHAFKFLPVIGEKIADAIQHKLSPDLRKAWAWRDDIHTGVGDGSRGRGDRVDISSFDLNKRDVKNGEMPGIPTSKL